MNDLQNIFTAIYKKHGWSSKESASGIGSELASTENIRKEIPILFNKMNINRVLDIGCGDFNWMKEIVGEFDYYLGVDVVKEIIDNNIQQYASTDIEFRSDSIHDIGLQAYDFDVAIINDVLVHLPFKEIYAILHHLQKNGVLYVLMSHFFMHPQNMDIRAGQWRKLNFEKYPFLFPTPICSITHNQELDKKGKLNKNASDKTLSLWYLEDLKL